MKLSQYWKIKKNQWFEISLQGWSKWRDHWASGKGLSMEGTLVWIREGLKHWCTNKICHIHRPKQQLEGAGEFHVYGPMIPFSPQIMYNPQNDNYCSWEKEKLGKPLVK